MSENQNKIGQLKTVRFLFATLFQSKIAGVGWKLILSLLLLVAGKLINVYIPFIYKRAVDQLAKPLENGFELIFWIILSYALARVGQTFFMELKDYIFQFISRRAQRVVGLKVFEKLHQLSLSFHLSRKTGKLSRYMELGTRGIEFVFGFMIFNVLPTLIEILLVTFILFYKYNLTFEL